MVDFARVQKELHDWNRDIQVSRITVVPKGDAGLIHLLGTIPGPVGTPYEGGTFKIDITSPMVTLLNLPKCSLPLKHPDISSQTGAICLAILKDQWSPVLSLKTVLLSVQAVHSAPQPDDPQDAVVAQECLRYYQKFVRTARHWTEAFAMTSSLGVEEKVQKLVEMGFLEASVRSALEEEGGDENLALEKLLPWLMLTIAMKCLL